MVSAYLIYNGFRLSFGGVKISFDPYAPRTITARSTYRQSTVSPYTVTVDGVIVLTADICNALENGLASFTLSQPRTNTSVSSPFYAAIGQLTQVGGGGSTGTMISTGNRLVLNEIISDPSSASYTVSANVPYSVDLTDVHSELSTITWADVKANPESYALFIFYTYVTGQVTYRGALTYTFDYDGAYPDPTIETGSFTAVFPHSSVQTCPDCNGTGHEPEPTCPKCGGTGGSGEPETCPSCGGSGMIMMWSPCGSCGGTGQDPDTGEPCGECGGACGYETSETCWECGGSGTVGDGTCNTCNGTGHVHDGDTISCPNCNGAGYFDTSCDVCGGSGSLSEPETCPSCDGTGTDPNTGEMCDICGGSGEFWTCQNCGGTGFLNQQCDSCQGTGQIVYHQDCETCGGTGHISA